MFAQHDRDIAHSWHVASHAADNIFFPIEVGLIVRIELRVVGDVVVSFREEVR